MFPGYCANHDGLGPSNQHRKPASTGGTSPHSPEPTPWEDPYPARDIDPFWLADGRLRNMLHTTHGTRCQHKHVWPVPQGLGRPGS